MMNVPLIYKFFLWHKNNCKHSNDVPCLFFNTKIIIVIPKIYAFFCDTKIILNDPLKQEFWVKQEQSILSTMYGILVCVDECCRFNANQFRLQLRIPIKSVMCLFSQNCSIYRSKLLNFPKVRWNESLPCWSMMWVLCWSFKWCSDRLVTVYSKEKLCHVFRLTELSENFYCWTVDCFNWKGLMWKSGHLFILD